MKFKNLLILAIGIVTIGIIVISCNKDDQPTEPDKEVPTVPLKLTASNVESTSADLSWDASTGKVEVTGYDIYQDGSKIGTSTNTVYAVKGLTANTSYSFTVRAKDKADNVSEDSNAVDVTTTDVATHQYTLATSVIGQGILNGDGSHDAGVELTITAIPDSGWEFKEWSGDLTGNTNPSTILMDANKIITATFTEIDTEVPTVPLKLTALNVGNTSVDLSWNAATDNVAVTGYDVYQDGVSIGTSTNTMYAVKGLTAKTNYSFTVKAKDYAGNISEYSTAVDVTTTDVTHQYVLTTAVEGEGTVNGNGSHNEGVEVVLTAIPALGWEFVEWIGDLTGSANPSTIVMNADKNVTAKFQEIPKYTLTTTVTGQGTVTGAGSYESGTSATLTATPASGWEFKEWSVDLTGSTNPSTIVMDANKNVTATFVELPKYTLTTTVTGQGTVTGAGSYKSGTSVTVTATPASGWEFSGWSGDLTGSTNPSTIMMDADKNVTATFVELPKYTLTTIVTGQGTVTGAGSYKSGTSVTVTATPASGWEFSGWSGDLTGSTNPSTIVMDANKNVTATFVELPKYTLTTTVTGQGTVTGAGSYESGTSATVTATPESGWEFSGWSGDLTGSTNPSMIVMNTDKNVTATFTQKLVISTSTEKYRLTWRDNPSTTMVIGWNQVRGTNPVVYYGTTDHGTNYSKYSLNKAVDRTVYSKGMDNNYARLTGLQPDTAYYFVIKDSEGVSERYWFKTIPNDPNTRLSIISGGDSRNNYTPRKNANTLVAKIRPHAVFFGGDMTSSSTSSQWQDWFEHWQLTIGDDGRIIPVVATRGNHESANDIRDLFDIPTDAGGEYYALNFGGNLMRTYTLNTEITPGGTQGTWLANDLAANASNYTWVTAQYHRATRPHEPGKREQNDQYDAWSKPFYTHGVQLVMESDSHVVKSTWPIIPSTGSGSDEGFLRADNDPNRAVYVGEGCWGAPTRGASDTKNWTRAAGSFNQFKWLWISKNNIELRTIKVDNASSVGQLSDNNLFVLPTNIDVWNPTAGSVITIDNPHR